MFNTPSSRPGRGRRNAAQIVNERAAIVSVQFIQTPPGGFTLAASTSLQKMFGSPPKGAVAVQGATTYEFECRFALTALSATSGSFGWGFLGTATFTSQEWLAIGVKAATLLNSGTQVQVWNTTASTDITGLNTNTTGVGWIRGRVRINKAGTLIPGISTSVGTSTPLVNAGSSFGIWPIGNSSVISVGGWT